MPVIEQFHEPRPVLAQLEKAVLQALPQVNRKQEARAYLDEEGASLQDSCRSLASLMKFSEREGIKLRATQDALKIHGALLEGNAGDTKIQFNFVGSDEINVMQILNPTR